MFNLSIKFEDLLHCWFGSYLTGRTQRVKLEDFLSDEIQCFSSVPQGSHLGPMFFIVDIDDVFNHFEHVRALGYADDLKLFMNIKKREDGQLFQNDLDRLTDWCHANKFDLNVDKCKSIQFNRNKNPIDFNYRINGNNLEHVSEIKF
jgi:Reverse transcriptase (RNA-dependent DNA polymerase)